MAAREHSNAACVGELGADAQAQLQALEAAVGGAVLSQRQGHQHLCALLQELQRSKEASSGELQVASPLQRSLTGVMERYCREKWQERPCRCARCFKSLMSSKSACSYILGIFIAVKISGSRGKDAYLIT